MSRNAAAAELEQCIAQIQGAARRGERLAQASGGLVDPKWFSAVLSASSLAAGDLDSKGLLLSPTEVPR